MTPFLRLALPLLTAGALLHAALAAFGVLACYTFWKWLNQPSWSRAVGMGVALGFALLTKFTFLILGPIWLALRLARRSAAARPCGLPATWCRSCVASALSRS